MPKHLTLTDLAVRSAPIPRTGTTTIWDNSLKGFGCRISPKGARTFIVLIASGRRQSIGRYPLISLSDARTEARRLLAEKTLGRIRPTHTAYDDARADFIAECETRLRPLTTKLYKRHLTVHYPFGRTSVADITSRQIVKQLNTLNNRPSEKEHASRIGRTFFRWCVQQHLIDRSPMESLASPATGASRTRVLTDEELKAIYNTVKECTTPFYRLVTMLILTGQRRGETSQLMWKWINDDTITIPADVTKNKIAHTFFIGPLTREVLTKIPRTSPYLFPAGRERVKGKPTTVIAGFSKPKADLDKACGVSDWVLHDIRRTYATTLQRLGTRLEVIEALLNHVSGSRAGIVGVYQLYHWHPEMQATVLAWERHLTQITAS